MFKLIRLREKLLTTKYRLCVLRAVFCPSDECIISDKVSCNAA